MGERPSGALIPRQLGLVIGLLVSGSEVCLDLESTHPARGSPKVIRRIADWPSPRA